MKANKSQGTSPSRRHPVPAVLLKDFRDAYNGGRKIFAAGTKVLIIGENSTRNEYRICRTIKAREFWCDANLLQIQGG